MTTENCCSECGQYHNKEIECPLGSMLSKVLYREDHLKVERGIEDNRLLKEFKNRFGGSVLYDLEVSHLLHAVGIPKIEEFLKENKYKLVKIK